MRIAIVGSGNVGTALASSLREAGHQAENTERGREAEAVRGSDAVVLAVPWGAVEDVASRIAPVIDGKLVIDATNPLKPDYSGLATERGPSGGEIVARDLPGARVVKAFNTLFASVQADPSTHGQTLDALYATDDAAAKEQMTEILRSMGFRPVYVGPLARARELEAVAFLNIALQMQAGGDWRTAVTLTGAPEAATS